MCVGDQRHVQSAKNFQTVAQLHHEIKASPLKGNVSRLCGLKSAFRLKRFTLTNQSFCSTLA